MAELKLINPTKLMEAIDSGNAEIIDVRTPLEFRDVHVKNARNIPLDKLDPHQLLEDRNGASNKPLYIICKSGSRGQKACSKIADCGFDSVYNVDGGTDGCIDAGVPVIRGKKAVSLERQVRIAAGSIIFAGAIAALVTGNAWFAAIPALMGAGLAFSGITDSCALGMIIARMPWNQVRNDNLSCEVV